MPYCDQKETIFLHIPKTGGTTVRNILGIRSFEDSNPRNSPTPQHFTCSMLRKKLGDTKYNSYYKFTFVRNPWSRVLSSYFWRQQLPKKRPVLPFGIFVENAWKIMAGHEYYDQDFGDHFIPQVEYTNDVDDVFRFEDFESGLRSVAQKLGLVIGAIPAKLPKHYDNYWNYYNAQTRDMVARIYQDDISEFDYKFGE